jgi:iron-only hydrogenase group A
MNKINRRKFIQKSLIYNGAIFFGATWISPFLSNLFLPSSVDYYLPIQESNPAIARYEKKCTGCRACIETCKEKQTVYGTYKSSKTNHVCIHCGTCIKTCEKGALSEKYHYQKVFDAINDPSKIVIGSVSPSVPAGIGDYFGMPSGSYLPENIVGACRAIGFDYLLDTNFSADLTIMEESNELQKRIQEKAELPQFTSCCPAWVKYVEIYYPSLLKHLSTTRSPIIMQGAMVKSYFANKKGIDPKNIIHVAITPCSAKKYEITREELTTDSMPSTDIAITTNELAIMLKSRNIDLVNQKGKYDSLMGSASGGGIIFGNTGGVMRAALRTVHYNITGKNPPADLLELKQIQGLSGLREATVQIGKVSLNVAVCYEMRNAKVLLDQVMNGSCKYNFIEVMACQGGCIGGAGQPANETNLELRMSALNSADSKAATRYSHENPEVKAIYKDFIGSVGGTKAEKYLHTSFNDKSSLLLPVLVEKQLEPSI